MKHLLCFLLIWMNAAFFEGCGPSSRDRENYGDITQTAGGITLIDPNEHAGGYGRRECLVCHNINLNVHRGSSPQITVEATKEGAQNRGEAAFCLVCHGKNGLEE